MPNNRDQQQQGDPRQAQPGRPDDNRQRQDQERPERDQERVDKNRDRDEERPQ